MAIANSRVVADVVEVSEFMDLAQRYQVRGVPKTVINDAAEFLGNVPEETFAEHIRHV
jgi:predicted DsbA family dithiol-disulfide isomerase